MAIKKTELYSSLWQSCDALRGGMDASQYKDYILTLLFVKYVSDKYAGDPHGMIEVPAGGAFADMVALKGDKEIGDKINKIIRALADANDLRGVIDVADFNDEDKLGRGKEMVDRLSDLVGIFDGLDLSANRAEGDDLLGDAYEYLMRHFATESGKSKGQFYTPAEVSRVLAKVIGVSSQTQQDETVYDPTCGSGSLLLKVADEAPRGMSIYGQEMDNATAALARMNMILHNNPSAEIWRDNTLANPHWRETDGMLKRFDYAVANPPFSYKAWTNGVNPNDDEFRRFEYGTPPAKNGDYAFLLHIVASLKSTGKAAVILPHGVLFRGNTEADIRRNLIRQGVIKGIIGLPANLFYGTGIPACIIVLDKENAAGRTGIFMIDASRDFIKDGNKNRLRSRDIHKIVDVFRQGATVTGYARMVPFDEIAANEYNLNIPRYIDSSEPEDIHDLHAHLNGGIPQRDTDALDDYWQVFPTLRRTLFAPSERDGYSTALVGTGQVKGTILAHPEFTAFAAGSRGIFDGWWSAHAATLNGLDGDSDPKQLIATLAEDLLARYAGAAAGTALIDKYAVYQLLLDYWAESMQDDVYLIVQDGWQVGGVLRELGKQSRESADLVINRKKYKADLIPPDLLVARYFAAEQAAIARLQAQQDAHDQAAEALIEEHGGDDGLLADAMTDAGKVTKATINRRLRELKREADDDPEKGLLTELAKIMEAAGAADKAAKAAQKQLDGKLFARYAALTVDEIKTLVVDDKWRATLANAITVETNNLASHLAGRVKLLEERYADPLPQLVTEVDALAAKVSTHLRKMGVAS